MNKGSYMNEGGSFRSVEQVTLLPPAAELDSAVATLALPIIETVSDDESVLTGDATSVDTASVITHYPIV